jgi:hypothetical protein
LDKKVVEKVFLEINPGLKSEFSTKVVCMVYPGQQKRVLPVLGITKSPQIKNFIKAKKL